MILQNWYYTRSNRVSERWLVDCELFNQSAFRKQIKTNKMVNLAVMMSWFIDWTGEKRLWFDWKSVHICQIVCRVFEIVYYIYCNLASSLF